MTGPDATDANHRRDYAIVATVLVAAVCLLASRGLPDGVPALAGIASALWMLLVGGSLAAVYMLGALGLGSLASPLIRGTTSPLTLRAGIGVAIMLWLSHFLGWLGLLTENATGIAAAWLPIALGCGVLIAQSRRAGQFKAACSTEQCPPRVSQLWWLAWVPGLAIMLVAACSPPGWLWDSEAGGYDVLSYHLQLPAEWLARGSLEPLDHNVYSYLPSYMEAAYLHLAAMGGPLLSLVGESGERWPAFLRHDGELMIACQLLHATMGVLTAWSVCRVVQVMGERAVPAANARITGILSGGVVLATPWVIVVGSMAYNELAVTALSAAALLAATDAGLKPWQRGLITGLLVGVACSAKPTAAFLAAPVVGVALLAHLPSWRCGLWALGAGCLAGIFAVTPWLVRNELATGNHIFPQGASLFGAGHWTAEQLAGYRGAHHFGGSIGERLGLSVSSTRGMLHPQWALLFPIAALALIGAVLHRATRRQAIVLLIGAALCILGWLGLTHLQSRFLLPMVVPLAAIVGLALAALASIRSRADGAPWPMHAGAGLLLTLLWASSVAGFLRERGGYPNAVLAGMLGHFTGQAADGLEPAELREYLRDAGPAATLNLTPVHRSPAALVYLIGDATPLFFRVPVLYHTTWDTSPLGHALRVPGPDDPGAPVAWATALRARGVTHILVNFSELERLHRGDPEVEGDSWYDPAVTPDVLRRLFGDANSVRPLREWPESGVVLFELVANDPAGGAR
ncbi:MAG: hypothetical protein H7Y88_07940 [Phycisphaerales bacterium]|nr:hypothetical protein [Phycisphaerales bacterium]